MLELRNWSGQVMPFLRTHWLPLLVLLIYLLNTLSLVNVKSPTFDEPGHIMGGYSYGKLNDYRLNPESGVLPQKWAALPLLFQDVQFPRLKEKMIVLQDSGRLGQEFLMASGNNPDLIIAWSRGMMILLTTALGLVIYFWSHSIHGRSGAWITLLLFIFCPTLLANGTLVTVDVPVTLFFLCSIWTLWRLLHRITPVTLVASAMATACLFLTKTSSLLFLPMMLILMFLKVLYGREVVVALKGQITILQRWKQFLAFAILIIFQGLLVCFLIWAAYGFRYSAFEKLSPSDPMKFGTTWESELQHQTPLHNSIRWMRNHQLLPEAYLYGVTFTINQSKARRCFLDGRYSVEGWWYFFPFCFLYKTPLSVFGLILIAFALVFCRTGTNHHSLKEYLLSRLHRKLYPILPLLILLMVYWYFVVGSRINIGHRHILLTYPVLYVILGAAGAWIQRRSVWMIALITACLLFHVVESVKIRPHYLAYFNQIAGGPKNGYRHLVDSSLDWGQDLKEAKSWIEQFNLANSNSIPVYLHYFGSIPAHFHEMPARILRSQQDPRLGKDPNGLWKLHPLQPGVYCISVNMLQSLYLYTWGQWSAPYETLYQETLQSIHSELNTLKDQANGNAGITKEYIEQLNLQLLGFDELRLGRLYSFLRQRRPDAYLGYSILVFHLTEMDLHQALYGPPKELNPEVPKDMRHLLE